MEMIGRSVGSDYTFGMNGQLHDDDVFKGFMSADYWGYDSRLGRRWEIDPLANAFQSPYSTFNNNPIYFADPQGLEGDPPKKGDEYKCEDGSKEYFDGTQYKAKPKGNNYIIIDESQTSGKWDLEKMNKHNTNFKVIYTTDIKKAVLEIKLN